MEEETRIEDRKVMTRLRKGPSLEIKSNVSIVEKIDIWKGIIELGKIE